jgi:hypothetical protein
LPKGQEEEEEEEEDAKLEQHIPHTFHLLSMYCTQKLIET